ncbi:MAG TPA: hypothetical protein VGZ73_07575 [Bryobacteraceae bacterium]|jgi:hypothetical protein|nr:hypothetical protein [Bryobacteraceae bacterium]
MRARTGYLTVVFFALALQSVAQTPSRQATGSNNIPRMPDGKPNLSGLWQAMTTAYWDLEDHSAQAGPVVQLGAIGAIPAGSGVIEGGSIPYKPEALAKRKENFANRLKLDPEVKCYLPGVPRAAYMPYPFQIVQSQKDVLIAYTYDSATRVIFTTRHHDAELDTWMGTSNGKWEDNTFVVDVTGFNGRAWLDRAGNFATDSLHVVERYSMLDANTLNYEAAIEDPAVFTRPWKINFPLYRHREKNARLLEFKCVEFVEELTYGGIDKKPVR